jgi:acyl-coenzyme A synthetase/AMP-(fatty) acid ligase
MYLGAVIVPLNPSLSRADVDFILQSCRPSIVIAGEAGVELLRKLHPRVICLAGNISGESLESDTICIENQPVAANEEASAFPLASASADDLMMIMYTSGTSARPKGLAHKIGRVFRNATAFAGAQKIDESSRFYLTLSMAYMGGFYNLMILPFLCGSSVVVDHVFDARSSLTFWDKAK